jgi:hypothetical protein
LPASLVAALVSVGYRVQASHFIVGKKIGARVLRHGRGWYAPPVAPSELWRRSRLAKRHLVELSAAMARYRFLPFSSPPPSATSTAIGAAAPARAPSPPSARPALRLV